MIQKPIPIRKRPHDQKAAPAGPGLCILNNPDSAVAISLGYSGAGVAADAGHRL
jgi:hypothetical protein